MSSAEQLAQKPDPEGKEGLLRSVRRWLSGAFLNNPALKFVSLVLSITLFILVNTNKDAIIGVNVGVSYQIPEDRVLVSERIDQVRVTIRGPWRRIKRFDEREIARIDVDLTNMRSGPYTFPEDAIRLPDGVTLLSINPSTVAIAFEKRIHKTVPVVVTTGGEPSYGHKVERISSQPSQVTIHGAQSRVEATNSVATRELRLDDRSESFAEFLPLEPPNTTPPDLAELADKEPVRVEVEIVPEMTMRTVSAVKVQPIGPNDAPVAIEGSFALIPDTVDVVLHGPRLVIEAFKEELVAYVMVYSEDTNDGSRQAAVQIKNLPEGVGPEIKPSMIELRSLRN